MTQPIHSDFLRVTPIPIRPGLDEREQTICILPNTELRDNVPWRAFDIFEGWVTIKDCPILEKVVGKKKD